MMIMLCSTFASIHDLQAYVLCKYSCFASIRISSFFKSAGFVLLSFLHLLLSVAFGIHRHTFLRRLLFPHILGGNDDKTVSDVGFTKRVGADFQSRTERTIQGHTG